MEPQGRREPVKTDREIVLEKHLRHMISFDPALEADRTVWTLRNFRLEIIGQGVTEEEMFSDAATRIRKEGNQ
jgi:hypothetical protein